MKHQNHIKPLLTIRAAHLDDAPALSQLITNNINHVHGSNYTAKEIELWQDGYSVSEMKTQILNREVFVLENGNTLCGTIQFDAPELKGFYVEHTHRGRYFAAILMDFLLGNLKYNGYDFVQLTCNRWTIDYYKRFRFRLVEKIPMYWKGHWFEEWKMIRELK